jgi:di/tricarboxylate transporter
MIRISSRTIIIIGGILVFLGFFLPLLMVIKVLESTFLLNFIAFTASLVGLFMGLIGTAQYVIEYRRKRDE